MTFPKTLNLRRRRADVSTVHEGRKGDDVRKHEQGKPNAASLHVQRNLRYPRPEIQRRRRPPHNLRHQIPLLRLRRPLAALRHSIRNEPNSNDSHDGATIADDVEPFTSSESERMGGVGRGEGGEKRVGFGCKGFEF